MNRSKCGDRFALCCLVFLVFRLVVARATGNAGTFDFDSQSYTFQEDAGTVQVKIVRTGDASGSVVVHYGLAKPMDATATVNKNFKFTDSVYEVNFDENQLEGFINVELINDAEYEANEYFYIEIKSVDSSASVGTTNPITTVFITDDGDAGEFNFAVPYIFCREDNGNAVVSIERRIGFSSASYVPVALKVATVGADSNATDGGSKAFDYLGISQELTWATDEVTKTFAVKVFNNDKYQPNSRAIKVRLLSVTGGATIGTKSDMWIYIIDDRDAGTLSFALSHYEVLENGGKVTVNVTRSGIPDATNVNKYTDEFYFKIQIEPTTIHFTPSSWGEAQSVKVSAVPGTSSNEVQHSKVLVYSASVGDTMYNKDNQPASTLFVQRFPAAAVLLDSSRVTTQENGGNDVTYDLQLDTTLVFSTDSQEALGTSTSLLTASNSSQSTINKTVKSVAIVRFDTYPSIQTATGSSPVGLATLRLFRLSGGENSGLGGIIVGVTTAAMETSDTWNETLLQTECTENTTFEDVSVQTDGETLVKQSREIDPNTNEFVPSSGWIEIDVTAAVNRVLTQQRDQSSSSSTISFLVYSRSVAAFVYDGVDEVTFASREHSDSTLRPQLKLTASGSVNLAFSGTASQSQQGNADAAIDGKTNSDSGIASTYSMSRIADTYPWWQIDLNKIRRIEDVIIIIKKRVPEGDLNADQLTTRVWVFLSNNPFPETSNETEDFLSVKDNALYLHEFEVLSRSFDASEADTITYRWRVNGEANGHFDEDRFIADYTISTEARYLRLQIEGDNSILLNEVEIYQQAFASTRIAVGGYMPSVAKARAGQNQIEFSLSSVEGTDPSPCDDTSRICRHELLFTSGNWRDSQQVQVHAIDDKVVIGDREIFMVHTAESLDPDYVGDSFCGSSRVNCNGDLFNDSSVKKLLILEDDENKVILSKSEFTVIEGSNAYPNAASFSKPSELQARYLRCSNDPDAVLDLHSPSKAACTISFSGASGAPWETCITNSNAQPLKTGSAWVMAGFEAATNLSNLSLVIPALTGAKYIRQLTLWGNPKTTITTASDILDITKDWIEMATVQVSMKSGAPQIMTMNDLSLFNVHSILIVFDKSYDSINRCILAPQITMTGYKPVTFPLPVRGDLTGPDSVPPAASHLSRMHLYGVPDSVEISLSSEPLADTFVSVLIELGSDDVTTFDATNASGSSNSLTDLVGANYESGDIRRYRMPTTLRFTPENWSVAQELTFLAVDDNTYRGNRTLAMHMSATSTDTDDLIVPSQTTDGDGVLRSNVQLSASLSYSSAEFLVRDQQDDEWPFHIVTKWKSASGSIQVTVIDDDQPGVTISASEVIESESSSNGNYSVSLDSAPMHDVTITILYERDANLFSVSPLELTFTRLNWYEPQWISIYPVGNDIYDAAYPFTLNYERFVPKSKQPILLHKVTSTDSVYDDLQVGTNENDPSTGYVVAQGVRIIIEDDDTGCEKEYECLNGDASKAKKQYATPPFLQKR
ncbi:hypothetical protein PC119_g10031 [Phytophthora cactorum]|nr:hypothetical protein PC119_g10031 [Phytophthora cactorum]